MKLRTLGTHLSWIGFRPSDNVVNFVVSAILYGTYLNKIIHFLDNSCGPINIEYPEYLAKIPALSSSYLQGDKTRFECFQTHWIKGDFEYKCSQVVDYNYPNSYRFEWNKGYISMMFN